MGFATLQLLLQFIAASLILITALDNSRSMGGLAEVSYDILQYVLGFPLYGLVDLDTLILGLTVHGYWFYFFWVLPDCNSSFISCFSSGPKKSVSPLSLLTTAHSVISLLYGCSGTSNF
ncbi:MAG TPA: hypothetical protein DCE41_07595 [Cytophagales bacterium]|nr:hypothetical protein [Cytophagales bacterium]